MDELEAIYLIAKAALDGGKASYRYADKKVAKYADEQGITKAEAWAQVRAEAKRRGDQTVVNGADWVLAHPVKAQVALAPLGSFAAAVIVGAAVVRRRRRPNA